MSRKMNMLLANLEIAFDGALTDMDNAGEYITKIEPPVTDEERLAALTIITNICANYMAISHTLITGTFKFFKDHPVAVAEKNTQTLSSKAITIANTFMDMDEASLASIVGGLSTKLFAQKVGV